MTYRLPGQIYYTPTVEDERKTFHTASLALAGLIGIWQLTLGLRMDRFHHPFMSNEERRNLVYRLQRLYHKATMRITNESTDEPRLPSSVITVLNERMRLGCPIDMRGLR